MLRKQQDPLYSDRLDSILVATSVFSSRNNGVFMSFLNLVWFYFCVLQCWVQKAGSVHARQGSTTELHHLCMKIFNSTIELESQRKHLFKIYCVVARCGVHTLNPWLRRLRQEACGFKARVNKSETISNSVRPCL